jgi:hypothetical protein
VLVCADEVVEVAKGVPLPPWRDKEPHPRRAVGFKSAPYRISYPLGITGFKSLFPDFWTEQLMVLDPDRLKALFLSHGLNPAVIVHLFFIILPCPPLSGLSRADLLPDFIGHLEAGFVALLFVLFRNDFPQVIPRFLGCHLLCGVAAAHFVTALRTPAGLELVHTSLWGRLDLCGLPADNAGSD